MTYQPDNLDIKKKLDNLADIDLADIDPDALIGISCDTMDIDEYIDYIKYCKVHCKKQPPPVNYEELNKKELAERPTQNITPNNLYDIWKNEINIRIVRIPIKHKNGWLFQLGKFRDDNYPAEKNGRVRMHVKIDPEYNKLNSNQIPNFNLYSDSPFWKYSGLDYIDFDDCYIQSLQQFLNWCDHHYPDELMNLE